MRILGLIVEYNPFHLGHDYHIKQAKALIEPELTIAVMSPHVVQRGDFSVVDKFTRTKWALNHGIDLVIELPSVFVLQSADQFAKAAVYLLDKAEVTDLVFGSEQGDIASLYRLVDLLAQEDFQTTVKAHLDAGKSFASAHGLAFEAFTDDDQNAPNDTLGVHYINAIKNLKSLMQAHTIKRIESGYHDAYDTHKAIQSASAIRAQLKAGLPIKSSVPKRVEEDLKRATLVSLEDYDQALKAILKRAQAEDLKALFSLEEGLENRLLDQPFHHHLDAYLEALKTPRYTYAKLRRTLMHVLLNTKKTMLKEPNPPYLRVLGMTKAGQAHLNRLKKTIELPLITKITRDKHPYLAYELRVTQVYDIVAKKDFHRKEFAPAIRTALKDPMKSAIMGVGDKR